MNPENDIYHAQPYLQEFSPYDDFEINEKHMTKDTMERDASPLTPFDPIITLYKGILGGG
jgi:hypothetical protein